MKEQTLHQSLNLELATLKLQGDIKSLINSISDLERKRNPDLARIGNKLLSNVQKLTFAKEKRK